ncbi:hypothetical protein Gasu2_56330 [Galdieria sulphuraria]|nr:hypothetical protein Gasu2_56330 [Galdieria sulphuraria]
MVFYFSTLETVKVLKQTFISQRPDVIGKGERNVVRLKSFCKFCTINRFQTVICRNDLDKKYVSSTWKMLFGRNFAEMWNALADSIVAKDYYHIFK